MSEFALTPEAADDRLSIWSYIAADKLRAADRVESAKVAACGMLAKAPLAGRVRPDVTADPVRFWYVPRYPNYIVVYDPASSPLAIIRILHGNRNLPVVLATEPS